MGCFSVESALLREVGCRFFCNMGTAVIVLSAQTGHPVGSLIITSPIASYNTKDHSIEDLRYAILERAERCSPCPSPASSSQHLVANR